MSVRQDRMVAHAARCVTAWDDDLLEESRRLNWPAKGDHMRLGTVTTAALDAEHDRRLYGTNALPAWADVVDAFADLHDGTLRALVDGSAGPEQAIESPARLWRSLGSLEFARRALEPPAETDQASRQQLAEMERDVFGTDDDA